VRAGALVTVVVAVAMIGVGGCRRSDIVGTLGCTTSRDCTPPATICSADGRCVRGCAANPGLCVGGSNCDAATGECTGGAIGARCDDDNGCDPPDVVCRRADGSCQPGCTVSPVCADGDVCNPANGHCCTPGAANCPATTPPARTCNSDAECPNAPANICSGGSCVPGCGAAGLCVGGLVCDPASGHCQSPGGVSCARDLDCDPGSYCTQSGSCAVLAFGGAAACPSDATKVLYGCATQTNAAAFTSCAGAPGPGGCPYCLDNSCFTPGACASSNDCHAGDACSGGLCIAQAPVCPTVVDLADVVKGVYAAGKEVCVRGTVQQMKQGADGMIELRLDSVPFLYVDVEPMYQAAGVIVPQLGEQVTVHGRVRWDGGHADRELLPVDWIGVASARHGRPKGLAPHVQSVTEN
jgi:hypothetical protein